MSVQQWTPIEEGRFHLRSMQREGETIGEYVKRAYPRGERTKSQKRIRPLIVMAKKEAARLKAGKIVEDLARLYKAIKEGKAIEQTIMRRMNVKGKTVFTREKFKAPL